MSRSLRALLLAVPVVALALLAGHAARTQAGRELVGRQPTGKIVVPTNQVLDPAGFQVEFPGRPSDLAVSPDGRTLAVLSHKTLVLLQVGDRTIMQTLPVPKGGHSFTGIAWAADGKTIYTAGTAGMVHRAKLTGGVASWDEPIALPEFQDESCLPGGLALSADGATLYVCLNRRNSLGVVDLATGQLTKEISVGVAPYGVAVAGETAYVTNWGGRRPAALEPQADSGGTPTLVDPVTTVAASGTVSVVDLAAGTEAATIQVGLHPCGLTLSKDASRLYVANANSDTVSVIDTAARQVLASIAVTPHEALPFGSAPNALALSPDGRTLFVANGGNNALAVVPLAGAGANRPAGFIPTGWYPGGVAVARDGKTLFVANVKGVGSLNAPTNAQATRPDVERKGDQERDTPGDQVARNSHQALGTVSLIQTPDAAWLARYTARVAENNRQQFALANLQPGPDRGPVPVPLRPGQRSVFKHVLYIIKENRTYDQVFGDMPEGNGDPSLVHYGEEVTPNHHKLAREFVLLDNFYCSGVLSADGHQWTDEAFVTDYLEKSFGGFERSYPYDGGDPMAYAPTGFIWDNALRHGLTFRSYGEFIQAEIEPKSATWTDIYNDYKNGTNTVTIRATTTVEAIRRNMCPTFIGFPGKCPDVYRAREFLKELAQFEARGSMPNLVMMLLPNDHTSGTRPGIPTPRAQVADNDLALGQIVEAVSRSRFWRDTCIFVVEDDPQAGLDHVDGHRTVAFCISPYTKRHYVDSTNYNQTGMVRTIELMLGLPPMNQFDLSATPMAGCFTTKPNFTPYQAVPNRIPLDEMNPPLSSLTGSQRYFAEKSLELPLDDIDEADEGTFNRILWAAAKGWDTPYPTR